MFSHFESTGHKCGSYLPQGGWTSNNCLLDSNGNPSLLLSRRCLRATRTIQSRVRRHLQTAQDAAFYRSNGTLAILALARMYFLQPTASPTYSPAPTSDPSPPPEPRPLPSFGATVFGTRPLLRAAHLLTERGSPSSHDFRALACVVTRHRELVDSYPRANRPMVRNENGGWCNCSRVKPDTGAPRVVCAPRCLYSSRSLLQCVSERGVSSDLPETVTDRIAQSRPGPAQYLTQQMPARAPPRVDWNYDASYRVRRLSGTLSNMYPPPPFTLTASARTPDSQPSNGMSDASLHWREDDSSSTSDDPVDENPVLQGAPSAMDTSPAQQQPPGSPTPSAPPSPPMSPPAPGPPHSSLPTAALAAQPTRTLRLTGGGPPSGTSPPEPAPAGPPEALSDTSSEPEITADPESSPSLPMPHPPSAVAPSDLGTPAPVPLVAATPGPPAAPSFALTPAAETLVPAHPSAAAFASLFSPATAASSSAPFSDPAASTGTPTASVSHADYSPFGAPHPGATPWQSESTEALRTRVVGLLEQLSTSNQRCSDLSDRCTGLQESLDIISGQLHEKNRRYTALLEQVTATELSERASRAHAAQLQLQLDASTTQLQDLESSRFVHDQKLAGTMAELVDLRRAHTQLRAVHELAESSLVDKMDRQAADQLALATMRQRADAAESRQRESARQQASLEEQIRTSEARAESAATALRHESAHSAKLKQNNADLTQRVQQLLAIGLTPAPDPGTDAPQGGALVNPPTTLSYAPAADFDTASRCGDNTPPFSAHPPCPDFDSLWTSNVQSTDWRTTLKEHIQATGKDAVVLLSAPTLPTELVYVDQLVVRPHCAELRRVDGIGGVSADQYPDAALVLALARRARLCFPEDPPAPDSEDDDSSSDESTVASVSVSKPKPPKTPKPATTSTPAMRLLPPSTPVSAALADTLSHAAAQLLPVEAQYLTSQVQDKEHVLAVQEATSVDPAGLSVFRRHLYVPAFKERREHSIKTNAKTAMSAGNGCMTKLAIPADLSSEDPFKCSMAYKNTFRINLIGHLGVALQVGAFWMDVLRDMYHRFNRDRDGHARLTQFVRIALRDAVLQDNPLLHAEVFMFKLDASFYSREDGMWPFDRLSSRAPTMDAPTMMARIVDFYLEKLDNPLINRENVLEDPARRQALFKKARQCLLADERDEARGKAVHEEFNAVWGTMERSYKRRPTAEKLEELDLQNFAETHLKDVGERFERLRTDYLEEKRSHRSKDVAPRPRRDDSTVEPKARKVAAAPSRPRPSVDLVDDYRSDDPDPIEYAPEVPEPRRPRKQRAAAAQRRATAPKGTPASPFTPPYAAAAVPYAPDPRPARGEGSSSAGAPTGRRTCPPPAGSKGEPKGQMWDKDNWRALMVDFDRLDEAVVDGQRTSVYASASKARPANAEMTELRLNRCPRPEPGQPYPKDACAYCFYRPKAKGRDASPDNPDFWKFGCGDGAHFPGMCACFKRYLAEGGDASDPPKSRAFLQSALRYRSDA